MRNSAWLVALALAVRVCFGAEPYPTPTKVFDPNLYHIPFPKKGRHVTTTAIAERKRQVEEKLSYCEPDEPATEGYYIFAGQICCGGRGCEAGAICINGDKCCTFGSRCVTLQRAKSNTVKRSDSTRVMVVGSIWRAIAMALLWVLVQ